MASKSLTKSQTAYIWDQSDKYWENKLRIRNLKAAIERCADAELMEALKEELRQAEAETL